MSRMRDLLAVLLIVQGVATFGQARLTVVIDHAQPPAPGTVVRLVIATDQGCFQDDHGCRVATGVSTSTVTRIEVDSLPPGRYGLMAYIDENNNGKLDKGWNNTPSEPNGFGNNAFGNTGFPAFQDAMVEVHEGQNVHRIRMR